MHSVSLESHVRPSRSQTRILDGAFWTIGIDVVLRVIHIVLESRRQVRTSLDHLSFLQG